MVVRKWNGVRIVISVVETELLAKQVSITTAPVSEVMTSTRQVLVLLYVRVLAYAGPPA